MHKNQCKTQIYHRNSKEEKRIKKIFTGWLKLMVKISRITINEFADACWAFLCWHFDILMSWRGNFSGELIWNGMLIHWRDERSGRRAGRQNRTQEKYYWNYPRTDFASKIHFKMAKVLHQDVKRREKVLNIDATSWFLDWRLAYDNFARVQLA